MSTERYVAAIEAAIEEPGIEFKRAVTWSKETPCDRFELVKDIAALCTYGGGLLIIGRNDDDKNVGSLTEEQAGTFETTKVNEFARSLLRPLPPIRVAQIEHEGDRLAVLDIPGFAETPPCFQKDSLCRIPGHDGRRVHFRRGDVFIRTLASQTARLCDPDDWRSIWIQMERNIRGSVTFDEGDDAGDDRSVEDARESYDAEYREEEVNFRLPFGVPTTVGTIELNLRPEAYIRDRIPRTRLKPALTSARASLVVPTLGKIVATPFIETELRNTYNGIMLVRNCPELHECEGGVLRTSGYLMYRRILPTEYDEKNMLQELDRKLPFLGLALELRLLLEFAARLSQMMATDVDKIDLAVAVAGLANRRVEDDSQLYSVSVPSVASLGGPGYPGTEQAATLRRKISVEELASSHDGLAVELYQEALWGFGIDASAMAVAALQGQFRGTAISVDLPDQVG